MPRTSLPDGALQDDALQDGLLAAGTTTLSSQLLKRGLRNVFIAGLGAASPQRVRMAGPAYTLRFVPAREDLAVSGSVARPDNPQRFAVENIPPGHVLVIDAGGRPGCGTLGGILVERLFQRGAAGVVVDGALRDAEELAQAKLPLFSRGFAAPPSYGGLIPVETQGAIDCGGVAVFPGDIVVTDHDGAIVIPEHLAGEVARDALEQERVERFAKQRVARGFPITGLYPLGEAMREAYQQWVARGEQE
ncbi:ribonuclease activity regulator RraA [Bosea sp. (in: a-proteobacteria)]|uniref:RraA family protein n=1 Tax=Bosea sp. (in: a-proteobacteria) TaxID=1871050 RepID=UPI00261D0A83|nr:ribonuclease activity regulator RraA [Bosea sp. (in: a-proteobacteria)]MCO5091843.1 ribonuclease activity regulator RraA [Bosea sp. (in: a-proteobacteria)]